MISSRISVVLLFKPAAESPFFLPPTARNRALRLIYNNTIYHIMTKRTNIIIYIYIYIIGDISLLCVYVCINVYIYIYKYILLFIYLFIRLGVRPASQGLSREQPPVSMDLGAVNIDNKTNPTNMIIHSNTNNDNINISVEVY